MAKALTPDQQTYLSTIVQGTGLDANVVYAWILAENGPASTHNYLNIGPGRGYPSAEAAGQAVVALLHTSLYSGILAAAQQSPAQQIAAIIASPWDSSHYSNGDLTNTYKGLTGDSSPSLGDLAEVPGALGSIAGNAPSPADPIAQALDFALGGHSPAELVVRGLELLGGAALMGGALIMVMVILSRDARHSPAGQAAGQAAHQAARKVITKVVEAAAVAA